MILARRLQDMWKVLWGRSESHQEVLRIRAEWLEIQAQISNTFAILNKWAQRVAKQEQRALAASQEAPTQEPVEFTPLSDRKTELYRRAAELRGRARGLHIPGSPASLSSPPEEVEHVG